MFLTFISSFCCQVLLAFVTGSQRSTVWPQTHRFLVIVLELSMPSTPAPADYTIFLSMDFSNIQHFFCPLISCTNIYWLYILIRFNMTDPYMDTTFTLSSPDSSYSLFYLLIDLKKKKVWRTPRWPQNHYATKKWVWNSNLPASTSHGLGLLGMALYAQSYVVLRIKTRASCIVIKYPIKLLPKPAQVWYFWSSYMRLYGTSVSTHIMSSSSVPFF